MIRYPSRSAHHDPPIHRSVYRFASALSLPLVASLCLFWTLTRLGEQSRVEAYSILPNFTLILLLVLAFVIPRRWLWPQSLWPSAGRTRLLSTLRRISLGGLARTEDGKFGDVLLADALTSYARPISEIYIALSMIVTRQPTTGRIDRSSYLIVPLLLAYPFAIRFRQCLIDGQKANALKYATAFPAIALSTLMRSESGYLGRNTLTNLWLLTALTNALYSFYWDVTYDWDLTLLTNARESADHPYGLRRVRYFGDPQLYYTAVGIDLVLRFAWALKLSPHLEHYYDIEGGIFLLEIMEVLRRYMWVYLRVETEWVRTKTSSDILLGDVGPKLDED